MKPRTTLSLAVIAGGLFAYIWFVEQHSETTREVTESSAKVLKLDQSRINSIAVQNGETKIDIQKKDGVWRIEQPLADRADATGVSQILSSLESLKHDSKISIPSAQEKEKLAEYGVAESTVRIKVKSDTAKETELLIGKDSAVDGKVYARVQGSSDVYVIPNTLRSLITKVPDDFRDKKLSDATPQQIQKFAVKTADGEIEAERKGSHWEILKPLKARGADQKINDMLASVLNAIVAQFLPESPTPEQGLGEPRGTLTMTVEGMKEPITLKIGNVPEGDENKHKSFAKLSNRPAVTVLQNSALDPFLKLRPNDIRDKKLVRLETDVIDRITIEPKDKPALVLVRKGESWVQKDGDKEIKINDSIPGKILASVQSTETTNFVSDVATELPKYGLDQPLLKLRLSSFASENTSESKAGERPVATIHFGAVEGDSGYAKLDDEPFIVASPKTLLESIPVHRAQIQPLNVWEVKPESAIALEVTNESGTLKLEKKDNTWKLAAGEGTINEEKVTALVGVLAGIHTSKWFAPGEVSKEVLEKPGTTIRVTLKDGEKSDTLTLIVGQALGSEGFYSQVSSKEGTFLLSIADQMTVSQKLLQ